MNPSAKGRSLSALLLLRGDPTWTAAVAPIQQWIRAGWHAAQDEALVGRGINLEFMMSAWNFNANKRKVRLIDDTGKRKWGTVKGPVDALELSLHRLGWTAESASVWIDDLGTRREVLEYSPQMWNFLLRDAVQRLHEREVAERAR